MVHRDVEKSLNLRLVQIHRQHPIGPGRTEQIRDQLRRDRHPRLVLPILPRVPVVRNHRRDARGRGPPERVDHDQQFHQVLVHRIRGRLDDEDVRPANVFVYLKRNFAIRKPAQTRLSERDAETLCNLPGQTGDAHCPKTLSGRQTQSTGGPHRSAVVSLLTRCSPPHTCGGDFLFCARHRSNAEGAAAPGAPASPSWLGREDSNLRIRIQSPAPYRLATPHHVPRRPATRGCQLTFASEILLESLTGGRANA